MALPEVVSREQWLAARLRLLAQEKELTRRREELNGERRRLPMVRVEKEYVFDGPAGKVSLAERRWTRSRLTRPGAAGRCRGTRRTTATSTTTSLSRSTRRPGRSPTTTGPNLTWPAARYRRSCRAPVIHGAL